MANKSSSYLHLTTERISEKSFIATYLANPRLVILLLIAILAVGITSFTTLPHNLNPEIKIPIVLVSTVLPGGSPSDVEQLVTIPLEDAIQNVQKIKTMTSSSRESVSIISIEFTSGVDPEKARADVKSAVDTVTGLPADTIDPHVQKLDFENQPVWTFALTNDTDSASLFTFAKSLQTKLKNLSEVDRVELSGLEETEVEITIKPETFAVYNASPFQIATLIGNSLKSFPAGSVKTTTSNFTLSIDPQVVAISDIRNLRLNVNNNQVSLSDIAVISEHPKPQQAESFLATRDGSPKRSITFNVFKTSSSNIDAAAKASEKLVNDELVKVDNRYKVATVVNTSTQIDDQFSELTRDFLITISLVVLVLFIFLGGRQALVSALSAPLSFLITFAVMKATGITLNFLSLFSLLLALGLLVDDTVVVISAMTSYYRVGKFTPLQTGLLVWRDFLIPIFTTTITTVWAFLPLLLSTGIIGEFIKSIPVVVSTALIASFFVSIFLILPLIILLLNFKMPRRVKIFLRIAVAIIFAYLLLSYAFKSGLFALPLLVAYAIFFFVIFVTRGQLKDQIKNIFTRHSGKRGTSASRIDSGQARMTRLNKIIDHGLISFETINVRYKNVMEKIMATGSNRRKAVAMVLLFWLFAFLLVPFGLVKNEFFPKSDEDFIYLSLEMPAGTSLDITKREAINVLNELKSTPEAKFVTADIGRSFDATGNGVGSAGSNSVLFSVILPKRHSRHVTSGEIADGLRNTFASYSLGKLQVVEISGGPPAGADLQIKLLGDNLQTLDSYANKMQDYLETQKGVTNIEKSIKPGTSKLAFVPDTAALLQNQVSIDQVGLYLRMYATGFNLEKKKFEGDTQNKDITLRLSSETVSADTLSALSISTPTGNVPLTSLGKLTLASNPTVITREDGKRTMSVAAAVTKGFNIADLNKGLEKYADSLNLPEGYSWKTGGVNEENNQSVQSILQAMLLSFMLIIITMVVQFSSFRRAIIVMLVIPLSVSGVFIIFSLTGTPLSFPALIGILALFGIVVKNSILVVDKIVQNEKHGLPLKQAIIDASASRLEPIVLTSFCTIIGLIPITLSDPLWRGLGGAIIAGLTFSGTIMLFFIPIVYYYFFKNK